MIMMILRKIFCKNELLLGSLIPAISVDQEKLEDNQKVRIQHFQSGWDRVKLIFKETANGYYHPTLVDAYRKAELGFCLGFMWGVVVGAKKSSEEFLNNNDATVFQGNKDAFRELQKKSMVGSVRAALKIAPMFAAFSGGFALFTACIQAYRQKEGILDYIIGGCLTGSLLRIHYGLKGMISGGTVGSLLGGIYGAVMISCASFLGKTPVEMQLLISSYQQEVLDRIKEEQLRKSQGTEHNVGESAHNHSHLPDENKNESLEGK